MIEEQFIPFKSGVPKKLQQNNFDDECLGYHETNSKDPHCPKLILNYNNLPLTEEQQKRPGLWIPQFFNSKLPQWAVAAPTYDQVLDWFIKNHKLNIWVDCSSENKWIWTINFIDKGTYIQSDDETEFSTERSWWPARREALLEGFQAALKILEKNK